MPSSPKTEGPTASLPGSPPTVTAAQNSSISTSPPASPPSGPTRWKSILALSLTFAALGALLLQIASSASARQSWEALSLEDLLFPIIAMSLAVWLSALKWSLLLRGLGYELSVGRCLRALLAAWPFAAVTPSRAGDFVRAVLVKDKIPLVAGHTSVLIDRLLDVQSLAILATIGFLLYFPLWIGVTAVATALFIWTSLFLWLGKKASAPRWLPARFATIVYEVHALLVQLRREKKSLVLNAFFSLLTWCSVQWVYIGLAWAFELPLRWPEGMFLWPMATLIGLVPITLAGMGTRDLAFVAILMLARQQMDGGWSENLALEVQKEVAKNASWFLATVSYTAISSWLFALIGLPLTVVDVFRKQKNTNTGSTPPREYLTRD